MSESSPDSAKRPAGYAILEADGSIIRLETNRWQADEIAARLPGRRVVDVWIETKRISDE